ncbi:hypothetical protein KAR34_06785 [bacterium]|nr:hypothetical protein [bacterium]
MTWKTMILYPTSDCLKKCPVCPLDTAAGHDKPIHFFKSILEQAQSIPEWRFVLNLNRATKITEFENLIKWAWKTEHEYSLVLPYEHLYSMDYLIFKKSQSVMLCLDEHKIPDAEMYLFFRALEWARLKNIHIEVVVSLTEQMIDKITEGLLLNRLLNFSQKVHFVVPKHMLDEFLTRARFNDLLNFLVYKMQRLSISKKIILDPCLMPILMPKPLTDFPECAYHDTFHVLPDGGIKICPYGPILWVVDNQNEFEDFLNQHIDPGMLKPLQACVWRQSWNLQETSATYLACSK